MFCYVKALMNPPILEAEFPPNGNSGSTMMTYITGYWILRPVKTLLYIVCLLLHQPEKKKIQFVPHWAPL